MPSINFLICLSVIRCENPPNLVNEVYSFIVSFMHTEITPSPGPRGGGDDSLSAWAIAGIVIAAIIVLILVIILVLLLIICLWIRKKNRSGNYKPGYDTEGLWVQAHHT